MTIYADRRSRRGYSVHLSVNIALLVGITFLVYHSEGWAFPFRQLYRYLYYIPIVYSAFVLDFSEGVGVGFAVASLYLPSILLHVERFGFDSVESFRLVIELILFVAISLVINAMIGRSRRERLRFSVLRGVFRKLGLRMDVEPGLREVLSDILEHFDAESGLILLVDGEGRISRMVGSDPREGEIRRFARDEVFRESLASYVIERGEIVVSNSVPSDGRFTLPPAGRWEVRNLVALPIRAGEAGRGILSLSNRRSVRGFRGSDIEILSLIAEELGVALDNIAKERRIVELRELERGMELRRLTREKEILSRELKERYKFDSIVGVSPPMQRVFEFISRVAPTDTTVLIQGESGTGKELVARAIHASSPRRDRPFVCANCAALPEALLESELFGFEKGAFTGATARRLGRFEMADGGTLFLDEVGDLSPNVQVKLLRVLQERTFERLGGNETVRVDIRLIAATNQDLRRKIREGNFREDLFYRLNVVPITLPTLEERKEDIPLLVKHFIEKYNEIARRNVRDVSPEALYALMQHPWRGNVRELENAVARAVVLARSDVIELEDVEPAEGEEYSPSAFIPPGGIDLEGRLSDLERRYILEALRQTGGSQGEAAKLLGISARSLRYLKQKYGIR
ncbi:MAG: sigma-54 interaction domain-containing protein [bacterium]